MNPLQKHLSTIPVLTNMIFEFVSDDEILGYVNRECSSLDTKFFDVTISGLFDKIVTHIELSSDFSWTTYLIMEANRSSEKFEFKSCEMIFNSELATRKMISTALISTITSFKNDSSSCLDGAYGF